MEKITAYFNESGFNTYINRLNNGKEITQKLINEFNLLKLNVKLRNTNDLAELIKGGESWIKIKIAETIETPLFGIFKMKKAAFVETLDLPDFNTLNQLANDCLTYVSDVKYYSFDRDKIILNNKEIESLKARFSVIAETNKQIRLVKAHTEIAKALTEFNNAMIELSGNGLLHDESIDKYFYLNGNEFKVSDYWYEMNKGLFMK